MKTSTTKRYLYSFSGIFFIILVWFIVSTIQKDDLIFPSLQQISSSIINIWSDVECLKYIGLDIIRTSPSHGTAFDIAGENIANPESMIEAIKACFL